jgi:hypothetical protein
MNKAQIEYYVNHVLNHTINSIGDWLRLEPWKEDTKE